MENEENFKKATLFTDPFGKTCVKYDLIEIELNEDKEDGKKIVLKTNPERTNQQKQPIIRFETVSFLVCLSFSTFFLFLPTGIPSIMFSQLMKKHYLNFNYEKAIKFKFYAKLFSYLNVLLGIHFSLAFTI